MPEFTLKAGLRARGRRLCVFWIGAFPCVKHSGLMSIPRPLRVATHIPLRGQLRNGRIRQACVSHRIHVSTAGLMLAVTLGRGILAEVRRRSFPTSRLCCPMPVSLRGRHIPIASTPRRPATTAERHAALDALAAVNMCPGRIVATGQALSAVQGCVWTSIM
jgi:hypothetical protein